MSSYTMQLKTYIEMWSQEQELSTRDKIEVGRKKLFDFEYPIFDENYRKDFETKFIRNFYTREIGFETEGLFKFQLESWLMIHMPYFNKMFESELISYDPLTNSKNDSTHTKITDKLKTDTRTTDGTSNTDTTQNATSNGNVTDDNFNRNIQSNTPDGRLNLTAIDGEGVIEYANEITESNDNNSSTSNSTSDVTGSNDNITHVDDTLTSDGNETESFNRSSSGKIGVQTYAKMLQEHRQTFLRIEKQIFEEMQQLFMLVY